jgi:hypothetical protein
MYSDMYGGIASTSSSRRIQLIAITRRASAIGSQCPATDMNVPGS